MCLFHFISFLLLLTFGTFQVLLGEVNTGLNTTQVVVKELKSSASVQDQMHFLEEAQPYRYTFPSVTSGRDPITVSQIENKHGVISDPERVDQNHVFMTGKFSLISKINNNKINIMIQFQNESIYAAKSECSYIK